MSVREITSSIGTPAAEVEIDSELVHGLLAEQHPDLADLPLRFADAGWDNVMYRLGDDLAVRLPRRALGAALIANEQRWLPLIAGHITLPAPIPLYLGNPSGRYPWQWSVIPWLAGRTADQSEPAADQAEPFGAFLRALHVPAPDDAPLNPARGVALQQRAFSIEQRIERLMGTTSMITPAIRRIWQEALVAPIDRPSTWLHADLHARNVLVDNGIITGIIDWGDITSGDCATDLASIWMLFADPRARTKALDAYGDLSEATLQRARGWALLFGVTLLDSGLVDNPQHALIGEGILRRLDEDQRINE